MGQAAWATNGDSLEGIGAVSEALGGTGVAAPQDGLTAIVNNPAGSGLHAGRGKSGSDGGADAVPAGGERQDHDAGRDLVRRQR